jgi:hypothetical protein
MNPCHSLRHKSLRPLPVLLEFLLVVRHDSLGLAGFSVRSNSSAHVFSGLDIGFARCVRKIYVTHTTSIRMDAFP